MSIKNNQWWIHEGQWGWSIPLTGWKFVGDTFIIHYWKKEFIFCKIFHFLDDIRSIISKELVSYRAFIGLVDQLADEATILDSAKQTVTKWLKIPGALFDEFHLLHGFGVEWCLWLEKWMWLEKCMTVKSDIEQAHLTTYLWSICLSCFHIDEHAPLTLKLAMVHICISETLICQIFSP